MAIQSVTSVYIPLLGDGTTTVFTIALANIPFTGVPGFNSLVPLSGAFFHNETILNSGLTATAGVDVYGNLTLTFSGAIPNNVTLTPQIDLYATSGASLASTSAQPVNIEGRKQSYRAFASAFTPVTSATSPSFTLQGSATKTIRITKINLILTHTTGASGYCQISLQRFSALSGGTVGTTPTPALNDTNNASATAVAKTWSAVNSSVTANGGASDGTRIAEITPSATNSTVVIPVVFRFGQLAQNIVLRGTSDFFGIIYNGLGTAPVSDVMIEWTEE